MAGACTVPPLTAQTHAFKTLTPTIAITGIASSDKRFADQWSSTIGVSATIAFPFYIGRTELGIERMNFDARNPVVPGFSARYIFVGWGLEAAPAPRLTLGQGVRLGSYAMHFDDNSLPESTRHESEMAVELVSRAALRAAGPWRLAVSGHYRLVLTDPTIRHLYLTAGVSRVFTSPEWLRDFLD